MKKEILESFCGGDYVERKFDKPFSSSDSTYATDGRIIIRVPRMGEFNNLPLVDIGNLGWDTAFENQTWQKLPDGDIERKKCPACKGTGKMTVCPDCDGEGDVKFKKGRNHYSCECKECDGNGFLAGGTEKCGRCNGIGLIPVERKFIIGTVIVDAKYIHLLKKLSNTEIYIPDGEFKPIPFRCDEGVGFVMPMRG